MKHTDKQLDRRQKRTRQAIQTALLKLMRNKPLEKITVSELSLAADINRKTFYNHYSNIQEVRRELEAEYTELFLGFLDRVPQQKVWANPTAFIEQLLRDMDENPERTRLLFDSGEHYCLANRFLEIIMPELKQTALKRSRHPEYLNYVTEYMVNGFVALLNEWVNGERHMTTTEFSALVARLISGTVSMMDFIPADQKRG